MEMPPFTSRTTPVMKSAASMRGVDGAGGDGVAVMPCRAPRGRSSPPAAGCLPPPPEPTRPRSASLPTGARERRLSPFPVTWEPIRAGRCGRAGRGRGRSAGGRLGPWSRSPRVRPCCGCGPAREVAGGDLEPYAVSCLEDDGGRPQAHDMLGGLTGVAARRSRCGRRRARRRRTGGATQSVEGPSVAAKSTASTRPVASTTSARGSVVKTRTSSRASTAVWSSGPGRKSSVSNSAPPTVGTGSIGS